MGEVLAMGGDGPYVWAAYGVTALVVATLIAATWRKLRAATRLLAALEQARAQERRPPRAEP